MLPTANPKNTIEGIFAVWLSTSLVKRLSFGVIFIQTKHARQPKCLEFVRMPLMISLPILMGHRQGQPFPYSIRTSHSGMDRDSPTMKAVNRLSQQAT